MRPIRLRFSGLHSYRELQDIDFTQLCEGGLFGIFGPTGSGKSTVLDAITLALYARVDRAGGSRQGILNDACDSLLVDFTFALGTGDDAKHYQVERRYKRSGPNSVNVTFARLTLRQGENTEVLADKDGDVTQAIQQILGLTHDDFTRAVVLPQGKFAEFLSMKGNDRRQMLERLFSLEAYGQRLMKRISSRQKDADLGLQNVMGAQSGLGNASKDAVAEASKAVEAASRDAERARQHLRTVRNEHEAAKQRRALQDELHSIEKELAPLLADEPRIQALQQELTLAEAAEPIRRDLESLAQGEADYQAATEKLERLRSQLLKAEAAHDQTAHSHQHARAERQSEEPTLIARRSKLEQGLEQEEQLAQAQDKRAELVKQRATLDSQVNAAAQQLTQAREHLMENEQALEALDTELQDCAVDPTRRRMVTEALMALERMRRDQKALTEQTKELESAARVLKEASESHAKAQREVTYYEQRVAEVDQQLAQLESSPAATEESLLSSAAFIERTRASLEQLSHVAEDEGRVERSLKTANDRQNALTSQLQEALLQLTESERRREAAAVRLAEAEEAARQTQIAHQAAILATGLQGDQPCPVCGSTHHPSPAAQTEFEDGAAAVRAAQQELRQLDDALAAAKQHRALLEHQVENAAASVDELEERLGQIRTRSDNLRQSLPPLWQPLGLDEITERLQDEIDGYTRQQKAAAHWKEQVTHLREELSVRRKALERVSQQATRASEVVAGAKVRYEGAVSAEVRAREELKASSQAFQERSGGLAPEQVEAQVQEMEAAEDRARQIQQEQSTRRQQVTAIRAKIDSLAARASDGRDELYGVDFELQKTQHDIDKLTGSLHELTSGQPVRELLTRIQSRLDELSRNEQELAAQLSEALRTKTDAERAFAVAEEAALGARKAYETASSQLATRLDEAGFEDADRVRMALRSEETRKHLRESIEAHERKVERLKHRRTLLREQLGDQFIDDESWKLLVQRLDQAQKDHEQALTRQSVAERDLSDMVAKHTQWTELEKRRIELQQLKDRLDQLQALCRANQFVEFVAEEYLASVAADASIRLGSLTRNRYALELDAAGGFVIRDDSNGGVRRPVSSLSGGETFITSLALALALSNQIQLHGAYPLEFFFLDEGFGTLDPDLLETVMTSLERLQSERVNIGIISHVQELKQRVSRRLVVQHASHSTSGSSLEFERA